MQDEWIEYNIFEEFIIGVTSFFGFESLDILFSNDFIDESIYAGSVLLRRYTLELDGGSEWNVHSFKTSEPWDRIIKLYDKIKDLISKKWTKEQIRAICQK